MLPEQVSLPQQTSDWVSLNPGSPVESASVLTGGIASEMYLLRTAAGDEAVLRRLTAGAWNIRFAESLLNCEWRTLSMPVDEPVAAPHPLAVDVDGSASGSRLC